MGTILIKMALNITIVVIQVLQPITCIIHAFKESLATSMPCTCHGSVGPCCRHFLSLNLFDL